MVRARGATWWVAPAAVAVAIGLWQTAGVWGPGPAPGDDTMAQLVRNDFGLDLLARGRTDGWFPRFMLGHQLFLFFGPGFTLVLGALRLASFGLLSTAGAYKAAGVVGVAGLGPAALFLGRSLGLRRAEAAAGAVLVLAVNSPFGLGLHGTYVIGLVPHQLAAIGFCLTLGAFVRMVDDARRRWVALGAASLAGVTLTHPITSLVLSFFLALVLLSAAGQGRLGWPTLLRVGLTGAVAVGATGFWTVPFLAHRDLQGPVTAWATPPLMDRLVELAQGRILWTTPVAMIAGVGVVGCVALALRDDRPWLGYLALGPSAYLSVAHVVAARVDGAVSLQLANRGLGYAGLIAMLAAGTVVGTGARGVARHLTRPKRGRHRATPGRSRRSGHGPASPHGEDRWVMLLATAAAAAVVVAATSGARSAVAPVPAPGADLRAVARVLADVVPTTGRFATERDYPVEITRTGTVHPDLWLAAASGRNTLNLFNPESSPTDAGFAAEDIGREPPAATAAALGRYGVTHVVTVRPDTTDSYALSRDFIEVARRGQLGVFALRAIPGRPPPGAMLAPTGPTAALDATVTEWTPESVTIDVDAARTQRATVALSWSPKWRATIDGRPADLTRGPHDVVSVGLPAGSHRLSLTFGSDRWDRLGSALSGLTLVGALVYSVSLMSRRRSRTA